MSGKEHPTTQSRSLTPTEQERVQRFKNRRQTNRDIFKVVEGSDGDTKAVSPAYAKGVSSEDAEREFHARVFASTGASSHQVGLNLLTTACEAVSKPNESLEDGIRHLNTIAKTMQSFDPQDEIEGQLLAQLAVLHQQSMSWLGQAFRTERVDFANTYLNGASKLLTRHHETLATLMKYRRGGEQRVHVEHVHVNEGGRAIVGNVGTGGGSNQKSKEGLHAKV